MIFILSCQNSFSILFISIFSLFLAASQFFVHCLWAEKEIGEVADETTCLERQGQGWTFLVHGQII
jgi:hypothetical protein